MWSVYFEFIKLFLLWLCLKIKHKKSNEIKIKAALHLNGFFPNWLPQWVSMNPLFFFSFLVLLVHLFVFFVQSALNYHLEMSEIWEEEYCRRVCLICETNFTLHHIKVQLCPQVVQTRNRTVSWSGWTNVVL